MPQVPREYGPSVMPQAQVPAQRINVIAEAFGAGLGQELGRSNQIATKHLEKMQAEEIETDAKQADTAFTDYLTQAYYNPETGFGNLRGKTALDAHQEVLRLAREKATELQGGLGDRAGRMFAQAAAARMSGFTREVTSHAATSRREWITSASTARVTSSMQNAIANFNDDKAFQRATLVTHIEMQALASQQGWSRGEMDQKTNEILSAGMAGRIERMAVYDPLRAQKFFDDNKAFMLGDDVAKIEKSLHGTVQNVRAQTRADEVFAGGPANAYTFEGFSGRLGAQESSGGTNLIPTSGSARGIFQYTEDTWAALVNSAAGKAAGLTLAGRFDDKQQSAALRLSVRQYENTLRELGAPFTEKNLYMVHFMGAGGFKKFWDALQNSPTANAVDLFPAAAKNNRNVFFDRSGQARSVAEVYAYQTRSFPGTASRSAEEQKAGIAVGLAAVDALAEQDYPGDVIAREKYRAAYTSTVDQHASSQANVRNTALALVTQNLAQGKYTSERAFLSIPENADAWGKLTEDDRRGLRYALQYQATLNPQGQQVVAPPPVNVTIDPHDEKQVAAFDLGYRAIAPSWGENALQIGVSYAAGAGVMPPTLRGEIAASLRNGDPVKRVAAADMISRLAAANPALAQDFSSDERATAFLLRDLTAAGMPPQEAVRIADERAKVPEAVREERKQQFNSYVAEQKPRGSGAITTSVDGKISAAFNTSGWFSSGRDIPGFQQLRAVVLNSAREIYSVTGDYNAAIESAVVGAHRTWGVTNVNGRAELMPGAPERLYGINNFPDEYNSAWIQKQLGADLRAAAPMTANPEELSAHPDWIQQINIRPAVGRVDAQGRPWYQVWAGNALLIGKDGAPLLWKPNPDAQISLINAERVAAGRAEIERVRRIQSETGQGVASELLGRGMGGF